MKGNVRSVQLPPPPQGQGGIRVPLCSQGHWDCSQWKLALGLIILTQNTPTPSITPFPPSQGSFSPQGQYDSSTLVLENRQRSGGVKGKPDIAGHREEVMNEGWGYHFWMRKFSCPGLASRTWQRPTQLRNKANIQTPQPHSDWEWDRVKWGRKTGWEFGMPYSLSWLNSEVIRFHGIKGR